MIAAGLPRLDVRCLIGDADVAQAAREGGTTRAAAAMRKAARLGILDGGVVAIGNAPTALAELQRLVEAGAARPALVVAVPVGFVGAAESKGGALAARAVDRGARAQGRDTGRGGGAERARDSRRGGRRVRRPVTVVGIGADGCAGLSSRGGGRGRGRRRARGRRRHLASFPQFRGERVVLGKDLAGAVERVAALADEHAVCVASGDPLLFGVGARLVDRLER